jgi:hypothetical protein
MWPWRQRNEYTRLEDYDRAWHSKKPAVTALTGPKPSKAENVARGVFRFCVLLSCYVPVTSPHTLPAVHSALRAS